MYEFDLPNLFKYWKCVYISEDLKKVVKILPKIADIDNKLIWTDISITTGIYIFLIP